ncbi:MAG TPA: ACP S-malonyltransferase, partial [Kofleriaceae bacterium]|nr:ACP S-malonyltransferase [Kofleriaceae bacterium]
MGMEADALEALCAEVADGESVAPANLNGGGQIVISGHDSAVDRVVAAATGRGAKRAVKLQVSAPFHCALMQPAAEALAAALAEIEIGPLAVPVVANVDAAPNRDPKRVKQLLVDQVTGAVRWEESIQKLSALGVSRALELGSGSVLRGLVRRIARHIDVTTIGEPHEVKQWEA